MPAKPLSNQCPYCDTPMAISHMSCSACRVEVEGSFAMTRLASLPVQHQRFIEMFILAGGSLKQIAEETGVSYPTVRSRLDKVMEALRHEISKTQRTRGTVLDTLGEGKPRETAEAAARLIKGI